MPQKVNHHSAELSSQQISRFYRQQIVTGAMPPGSKLPTNKELTTQWATSTLAVQRALAMLAAEGLLKRTQGRGTFVSDPVHRACIGILVGGNLDLAASPFYRHLCSTLQTRIESPFLSARIYDGLTHGRMEGHRSTLEHLRLDVSNYDFKGMVLIGTSNVPKAKLDFLSQPAVHFQDEVRGIDVLHDLHHFGWESFRELSALGFRRFAHFTPLLWASSNPERTRPDRIQCAAKELGISSLADWDVVVEGTPGSFEHQIHDLLDDLFSRRPELLDRSQLPEVILCNDDISVRPLVFQLMKHGIRIPEEVRLCVQSTEGVEHYYGVPVFRYEISNAMLAEALLEVLQSRMCYEKPEGLPLKIRGHFRSEAML